MRINPVARFEIPNFLEFFQSGAIQRQYETYPLRIGHWTYQCFGDEERLLYIGYTGRFLSRIVDHMCNPEVAWTYNVKSIRMELWPSHEEALAMEIVAIHEMAPIKNRLHNIQRIGGIQMRDCSLCWPVDN